MEVVCADFVFLRNVVGLKKGSQGEDVWTLVMHTKLCFVSHVT